MDYDMAKCKYATYNVNSIRSRLHIVIPWIKENKPDILCFQETKVDNENFPVSSFQDMGYHIIFSGSKGGRNGVAMALRKEPSEVYTGFLDQPREEDRVLTATINGVIVINTYVPQGYSLDDDRYKYKLQFFNRLKEYIENTYARQKNILWCGDMNVAPLDIDVTNPGKKKRHVCFHTDVKKAFHNVASLGFVDLFRKYYPDEPGKYTFFDYRVKDSVERNIGWRIDHMMASQALAARSQACYIDMKPRLAQKPSDHTVLVGEFDY